MHKYNISWLVALLVAFSSLFGACSNDVNHNTSKANQANDQIKVKQTIPESDLNNHPEATVARLERLAEGIRGVKHANCVIFGQTAIVGINVDGDMDRARVGTIKYAVAEALKKDPVGINAIVTADMDLNHRLQEIRGDINQGRPLEGFAEELADIVGRIVPQLPRDTVEPETMPPEPGATTQEQGSNRADTPQNRKLDPQSR